MARSVEHDIQVSIIDWAEHKSGEYPELQTLHAIPNGGHRHKAVAGWLRAEGVKAGVPDLFLPLPDWIRQIAGLYMELKAPGREKNTSEAQDWWISRLTFQGFKVVIVSDFDRATKGIIEYVEKCRQGDPRYRRDK